MKEFIQHLVDSQRTVLVYIPGKGYMYSTVEALDDDRVILNPEEESKIILHYTQFLVKHD